MRSQLRPHQRQKYVKMRHISPCGEEEFLESSVRHTAQIFLKCSPLGGGGGGGLHEGGGGVAGDVYDISIVAL